MRLWYLRRAVPWTALLGCVAAAAALAGLATLWDTSTGLALPLAVLLAGSACAFVLDDAAVAVTTVTPRASWARSSRLGAATLPLVAGLVLLAAQSRAVDVSGWALVLLSIGTTATATALLASRRQRPRPGAPIASAVVLLGITPMVVGPFFDVRSPYPLPELDGPLAAFWLALAGVGGLAMLRSATPATRWRGHRERPAS